MQTDDIGVLDALQGLHLPQDVVRQPQLHPEQGISPCQSSLINNDSIRAVAAISMASSSW